MSYQSIEPWHFLILRQRKSSLVQEDALSGDTAEKQVVEIWPGSDVESVADSVGRMHSG